MSQERSADWLRGAIEALDGLELMTGFGTGWAENTRKACQIRVDESLRKYSDLLDELERRESSKVGETRQQRLLRESKDWPAYRHAKMGYDAPDRVSASTDDLGIARQAVIDIAKQASAYKCDASEVIRKTKKALGSIAWFLNSGVQETSMAPRCCPVCSKVQLDGRNEHYKSCNAVEINAAIASIDEWESRQK